MAMLSGQVEEVIAKSVTKDDVLKYRGGIPSIMYFNFPTWGELPRITDLPPEVPPYWTPARDAVLRNTILYESFWASSVAIAGTKAASTSFELSGDVPLRVKRSQDLMLQWDGKQGYVAAQEKGVQDFTCTENGEFHEIVRVHHGPGSSIVGLVHLDSRRCLRTGDPDRPIVYRDIMNRYHEMRDYQIISMVDQPDPGAAWFGIGHCAAARAYKQIYKLAALEQYILEKLTGSGATELEFVSGVTRDQVVNANTAADEERAAQGAVYYKGVVVIPTMADTQVSGYRVPLKSVPDGFDRKQELDVALLAYANALGLVLTDLQPLSGQGLGTGSQTVILEEKVWGRGMAARRKQLTHQLNESVFPDRVVFAFNERDLREEKTRVEIAALAASTRSTEVQVGEITPDQSRQLAVKDGYLPKDFVAEDEITFQTLADDEKPEALPYGMLPPGPAQPLPVNQTPPLQNPAAPTPGQIKPPRSPSPGISVGRQVKESNTIEGRYFVVDDGPVMFETKERQPTPAQAEAGNYPKKHTRFQGLPVSIENPAGMLRQGIDKQGKLWQTRMKNDYGYIKRTEGTDGDHVDVYLGPNEAAPNVHVVHQLNPLTGSYDEDKCMMGFNTPDCAKAAYLDHTTPEHYGGMTVMPLDAFKDALTERKGMTLVARTRKH